MAVLSKVNRGAQNQPMRSAMGWVWLPYSSACSIGPCAPFVGINCMFKCQLSVELPSLALNLPARDSHSRILDVERRALIRKGAEGPASYQYRLRSCERGSMRDTGVKVADLWRYLQQESLEVPLADLYLNSKEKLSAQSQVLWCFHEHPPL